MSERISGKLAGVSVDRQGDVLAVAVAIGATTVTLGSTNDFDERGGFLLLGGEAIEYADFTDDTEDDSDDDGPTVLTLLTATTVASDEGDPIYVLDTSGQGDQPATEYVALVFLDDNPDGSQPVPATISAGLIDQLSSDYNAYVGKSVHLEVDDDDDLELVQISGSSREGSPGGKVLGYQDEGTATVDGADVVVNLTYRPIPDTTVHVYWHPAGLGGLFQRDDLWTLDQWTLTFDGTKVKVGDKVVAKYLYNDPTKAIILLPLHIAVGDDWLYASYLGASSTYAQVAFDDSTWATGRSPFGWEPSPSVINTTIGSSGNGLDVWCRKHVVTLGGDLTFRVPTYPEGEVDNNAYVYLDGTLIWSPSYPASGQTHTVACNAGEHVIAIRGTGDGFSRDYSAFYVDEAS